MVILSRVVLHAVLVSAPQTPKTIKTREWFDEAQNLNYLGLHLLGLHVLLALFPHV